MWVVQLTATTERAGLLLCEEQLSGAQEEELPGGDICLRLYFENEERARELALRESGVLQWEADQPPLAYQQQWQPTAVGRRFLLRPPWLEAEPQGRIELVMQPGAIFGSGDHATTQLCLELLEEMVQPQDVVLDVGTGTGILAIAAVHLGAARVYAFDSDTEASTLARRASEEARAEVHLWAGTWSSCRKAIATGLCANLPGGLLLEALPELISLVRRPGWIILSGILDEHRSAIESGFSGTPLHWRRQGDWWAVLARLG